MRELALKHVVDGLDDTLLKCRILAPGPPVCNLCQAGLAEVLINILVVALVCREEGKQILDAATLEGTGQMVHRLLREKSPENCRDKIDRYI